MKILNILYLRKITLSQFKNYEFAEGEFHPGLNIITGDNGSGKTNLLDALHYLAFCKGFIQPSDAKNIRNGEEFFYIEGTFQTHEKEEIIYCGFRKDKKKIFRRNRKEYEKLSDHIGLIPLVVVSPGDTILLSGGSEERRRFTDSLISVYDKRYLENLILYNKLLINRNILLKKFEEQRYFSMDMLEVYDEQMNGPAAYIHKSRQSLSEEFIPLFNQHYQSIAGKNEQISLEYKSDLSDGRTLKEHFSENLNRDRQAGFTTTGIHKDDLIFLHEGQNVRTTASQGQQKTYLTALKISQFELLKLKCGLSPILLLDDIFDKLDDKRVSNLVTHAASAGDVQIFITDTGNERIEKILKKSGLEYHLYKAEYSNFVPYAESRG